MTVAAGHGLLARLERAVASHAPTLADAADDVRRAAVAAILRGDNAGSADLLFIKRAVFEGDPWSGQVALPGGRHEPADASLAHTAMRETHEEIGADLGAVARLVGALDELHPRTAVLPPIVVRPHLFVAEQPLILSLSEEVADVVWVPLATLLDPATRQVSEVAPRGYRMRVPSYVVGEHVIWGMTERILDGLLGLVRE